MSLHCQFGVAVLCCTWLGADAGAQPPVYRSAAEILAATKPSDWRALDPDHTLYLELPSGRVVIELAPRFAPHTVANIETLVREHYFDGLAVIRVQDNYVVQWGDPEDKKPLGLAAPRTEPEFTVNFTRDMPFTALPDRDGYAPQVGFSNGLPAGRNLETHQAWLAHCYGMVGVGRDDEPNSGNGSSLYAVIGPARILDRNPVFSAGWESRRNRRDSWTRVPAGFLDVCSASVPVRASPTH